MWAWTQTLGRLKIAFDYAALTTLCPVREYPGVVSADRRWHLVRHNDLTHLDQ